MVYSQENDKNVANAPLYHAFSLSIMLTRDALVSVTNDD